MNEKLENKIIAAAYNELSFFEKRKIYKLIKTDNEAASLYDHHRKAVKELQALKNISCPDELVKNAENIISVKQNKLSLLNRIYFILFKNPAVTFTAATVFLFVVSFVLFSNLNNQKYKYSHAQIELANKQTEQALAIVSKVFSNSQRTLETNILRNQVAYPIKNSINEINNLFN